MEEKINKKNNSLPNEEHEETNPEKIIYLNNKFKELNKDLCIINKNSTNEDLEDTLKSKYNKTN